jgi:hypothetical protein
MRAGSNGSLIGQRFLGYEVIALWLRERRAVWTLLLALLTNTPDINERRSSTWA